MVKVTAQNIQELYNAGRRYFTEVNLRGADLRGAELSYADLSGSDLYRADLRGANLTSANLDNVHAVTARLDDANLEDASLFGADLTRSDFVGCNLKGANLSHAVLGYGDFKRANLTGANLGHAVLQYANLSNANLTGACTVRCLVDQTYFTGAIGIPDSLAAETLIVPEGDIIGWKKLYLGRTAKLFIPANAKRSNATSRKCRAEFADVLEIWNKDQPVDEGRSIHNYRFIYRVGERVHAHEWCEDRWEECAGGIHFFLTKWEAERW